ncbi:Gfo/Idh/MocA family oxidoreductase [Saccharopolyspora gloriosae]|uniref:Gfo/Idh/MocA family oxidoreductase n=1 Tax=Saccharopolyspora gloriosae TaxID=455344 RepID=UPI001FB827A6|nr:Gfo/Idh/MocA family oxidoreductase [Saccharopolyspora gloriosae]
MLHSLVVGLGRAGAGLHLRVLAQARELDRDLFRPGAIIACDPAPRARRALTGVIVAESVRAAAELVSPARTVVHLCTPPVDRPALLTELAELGFRQVIVEKPLASDLAGLAEINRLRSRYGMRLAVVAHWLDAELTRRLAELVDRRTLGQLRSISFHQHKPRFTHSISTHGHPTAFDVEIPHALGAALRLAGSAELLDAGSTDMRFADLVLPGMGGARLALRHHQGVRTDISSDLTAPVRERRVELVFERGRAVGHYPLSDQDHHAQLSVHGPDEQWSVFPDDALTEFTLRTYRRFNAIGPAPDSAADDRFALQCEVIRLLSAAKQHCRGWTGPAPQWRRTSDHAG